MSNSMRFDNKLEIRYAFNDKSNYMDSWVLHRCEKEVLNLIRSLADMLDVSLTVYNQPYDQVGGFRERLAVAGADSRSISIVLNLAMRLLTTPTLSVGGQHSVDRSATDEAVIQQELAVLRRELRLHNLEHAPSNRLVELLGASPRFCKCKSNFFEALKGYPKVTKVSVRELNGRDRIRSGSLEVRRERFDSFILRSDNLPMVRDQKATIEIISPVLNDSKIRWKGIYNKGGILIDFYMQDEDFKQQMIEDKLTFTNGMCIDCVLEISRRLSEMGEITPVAYSVTTVIRTRTDKLEILTPQGKRHLRKLEAEKRQLTINFG